MRTSTRAGAEARLVVFAKAPQAGRVKTRLVPVLGAQGAARLHKRLVVRALRTARDAARGAVELCCSPARSHPFFMDCARRFGVTLRAQGRGDLGARMRRAFERGLRGSACVVLIGADCPALRPADLRAAVRALESGADAVLAPAEDGGYALIGLRRFSPRLFSGVEWGGERVLAQTRARLRTLGWRWKELRTVWDVDRPEDVLRLKRARLLERTP